MIFFVVVRVIKRTIVSYIHRMEWYISEVVNRKIFS